MFSLAVLVVPAFYTPSFLSVELLLIFTDAEAELGQLISWYKVYSFYFFFFSFGFNLITSSYYLLPLCSIHMHQVYFTVYFLGGRSSISCTHLTLRSLFHKFFQVCLSIGSDIFIFFSGLLLIYCWWGETDGMNKIESLSWLHWNGAETLSSLPPFAVMGCPSIHHPKLQEPILLI